jgi:hypothetical protein
MVAAPAAPFGNTAIDTVPVGTVGAEEGRKVLEVAAVSLTAKGIDIEDALTNVREGRSDVHRFVVIVAVFALLVVCAIHVGVAC